MLTTRGPRVNIAVELCSTFLPRYYFYIFFKGGSLVIGRMFLYLWLNNAVSAELI